MKIIAHNKPWLGKEEEIALNNVVASGWVIADTQVKKFEKKLSKILGFDYAIGLNSGTSSLHVSLLALGVGKGDEVILPSYTPSDLLNAVNYISAKPVIVDIEKNSFNVDPKQVGKKINKKTKAIIIPHMFGFAAKVDEIEKFGIPIINDCAQALGTFYNQKPVASLGDFVVLSFYATKLITTGQGGMVLTNNKKYYKFIKDIIDYNGRDNYKVRFNYPMTDISASLGNVQIEKLDIFIKRRREIGARYQRSLKNKKISFWPKNSDMDSNYYRFLLKFKNKKDLEAAKEKFKKNLITVRTPINEYELLHNCIGLKKTDFPNAEEMVQTVLSIPIYPALKNPEVGRITAVLSSL